MMEEANSFSPLELETASVDANSKTSLQGKSRKNGVFLSYPWLVVLILSAVALSTLVGLIVHFAHPESVCICPNPEIPETPSTTPNIPLSTTPQPIGEDYMWELCLNISAARNECFPCHLPTEAPVTTTPSPIVNYRLPGNLEPLHYNIELRPDIYGANPDDFHFEGRVSMHLKCTAATNYIVVHKRMIDVTEGTVKVFDSGKGEDIPVSGTSYEELTEFFRIRLTRTLNVNDEVEVSMDYTGPLMRDMKGMFWSDYMEGGQTKYMVGTQFQSTDARKAFPCLDEPNLKATFNITLEHKAEFVALTNMPKYTYEVLPDGWVRSQFEKTNVRMPTYLVAFGIADYGYEEAYANGTNAVTEKYIRNWAPHEDIDNGNAEWATEVTQPLFDYFENLFQFAFALPKTDQIVIPEFASFAMENWGLITYRPVRILYNPNYSTTYAKEQVAATIAHELLHMWLGNVVTCNWWGELWLQEGMARYYQHLAENDAVAAWDSNDIFISQVLYGALDADSTGLSHPLTDHTINSPAEAGGMFSTISYDKGACIIRMVKRIMGESAFDQSMQEFIDKMQYSNAIEDDLFASWEAGFSMTPGLGEILKTWTNQIGYPVVTFTRTENAEEVMVTQKMFLADPEAPITDIYPTRYEYTWHIPLTYATNAILEETEWLHRENGTITATGLTNQDWIVGNLDHHGFYRVNYDSFGWDALIQQLIEGDLTVISPVNRASLIQDAFTFARSGDLDQLTGLQLLAYLDKEDRYLPFFTMATVVPYLDGMIYSYPDYINFRTFMRKILQPTYTRLGWDVDQSGEDLGTLYLRSLVLEWSCSYELEECVKHALTLFGEWLENSNDLTKIHPDLRAAVYCTAARENSNNWEWLLQRYLAESDETETAVIRNALMCSRQPWELQRLYNMAVDNDLKARDVTPVLLNLARNVNAKVFVWEYLNTMWDKPLQMREAILSALTEHYHSEEEYKQIRDFVTTRSDDLIDQSESLLRPIRANLRWQERNKEDVSQWLKNIS